MDIESMHFTNRKLRFESELNLFLSATFRFWKSRIQVYMVDLCCFTQHMLVNKQTRPNLCYQLTRMFTLYLLNSRTVGQQQR